MPTLRNICSLTLGLSLSSAAFADGVNMRNTVDCGRWVAQRKIDSAIPYQWYIIGYLNGLSQGYWVEFWRRGGHDISPEQAALWVDNYCQENPLKDLTDATLALFDENTGSARFLGLNARTTPN